MNNNASIDDTGYKMFKGKLSDDTIAAVIKVLQVGLLTGTDITDHLRMLELAENENGLLEPDPSWIVRFDKEMQDFVSRAEVLSKHAPSNLERSPFN